MAELFAIFYDQASGNFHQASFRLHNLYFESSALILTFVAIGKTLEAYSKGKTLKALKGLISLSPEIAYILADGKEVEVPVEQVNPGDIFVARPGSIIPVDGVITKGFGSIDESALTGESVPAEKQTGETVYAGTINLEGFLTCAAVQVGEDTSLSKIIRLVENASTQKAPISKMADRVSYIFVPTVIVISIFTAAIWLILGQSLYFSLSRAVSVLVISCPCALGLAAPVAVMTGSGAGARRGILFKTASALEEMGKALIIAFDKTGTLTVGHPALSDIITAPGVAEEDLVSYASSLEAGSEHPIAKAVSSFADAGNFAVKQIDNFKSFPGRGVTGEVGGSIISGGKLEFIKTVAFVPEDFILKLAPLLEDGKTPLYFALDSKFLGCLFVCDKIRESAGRAVEELKNLGIRPVMLTGDSFAAASFISRQTGICEFYAGLLPEEKEALIRKFQADGKTVMIGDGANDSPALARADIGVAMGGGTGIALDCAEVVLMKNDLLDVPATVRLSRAALKIIKENLFWAFFYNAVGIPLAAGVWFPIFGWVLHPAVGAAAMGLSSACVVLNALRLNFFNPYDSSKDGRYIRTTRKREEKLTEVNMEKTILVQSVTCSHCTARIEKALRKLSEVVDVQATRDETTNIGTAKVVLSKAVSDALLKKAIEDQDYEVISIK